MRVSTSQIFDSGSRGIGRNQSELYRLQTQMASGRKIQSPEDDPIAAAQALVLTQAKSVSTQFLKNQSDAQGKLGVVNAQLTALTEALQSVRDRIVQAGNTTLANTDRNAIAQELESSFAQMMSIANAQDRTGNYMFSGFQGAAKPFSATSTGAVYAGDDGKRLLQVDASRQIASNVSGSELFERVRNGNGTFVTSTGGVLPNQGTGVIDQGSVTDPLLWNQALAAGVANVEIRFTVTAGVTQYELFDGAGLSISATPMNFTPGQSIALKNTLVPPPSSPLDFGASVVIEGQPTAGDKFSIAPSANESIFTTLRSTITLLTQGIGVNNTTTKFANDLAGSLQKIDQALENVTRNQVTVGSSLKELDTLSGTGQDLQIQYESSLSSLQDLDYVKASTDLANKKMQYEAAMLSFQTISQLSLFSIL